MGDVKRMSLDGDSGIELELPPLPNEDRTASSSTPYFDALTPEQQEIVRNATLSNDKMFCYVMSKKELLEPVLRDILNDDNLSVISVQQQQTLSVRDVEESHNVRLDIYAESAGKRIDVEMQVSHEHNLIKRARYYSSMMDSILVDPHNGAEFKGKDRYDLPDTYVIFLCSDRSFPGDSDSSILRGSTVYVSESVKGKAVQDISDGRYFVFVNYDKVYREAPLHRTHLSSFAKFASARGARPNQHIIFEKKLADAMKTLVYHAKEVTEVYYEEKARNAEEYAKRAEEELKRAEEEAKRAEEELKRAEEEVKRSKEETKRMEKEQSSTVKNIFAATNDIKKTCQISGLSEDRVCYLLYL